MRLILSFLLFSISTTIWGQKQLTPIDNSNSVIFKIKNFGVAVDGSFKGLKGKIGFDEKNLNTSYFEVSVDANTINTSIDARDKHLRKAEYFDVAKYPQILFKSTKIVAKSNGVFNVTGNLTLKGITKAIQFDFKPQTLKDNSKQFTAELNINRRTFGIGGKSISMSDVLTLKLNVIAK